EDLQGRQGIEAAGQPRQLVAVPLESPLECAGEAVEGAVQALGDAPGAAGEAASQPRAQVRQLDQDVGPVGGGRLGRRGRRAGAAVVFSKASCHSPPASVERRSRTVSRNSPLSSQTVGRANRKTCMPSCGGAGRRRLSFWNMTQRICALRSRSAKYQ